MTSSAFIFPDPAVTPEFTATNGITYVYNLVDEKWTVKSISSTQFLTTTGGTVNADGGSQSSSGNLIIQDKAAGGAGRLYVKDKDGNTNLSVYPSGALETNSTISLAGPNANKNLRCYGSAGSTLKILTGDTASSLGERMSVSSTSVTFNTNLVNNFDYSGINIYASGTVYAGISLEAAGTSTLNGTTTIKAPASYYGMVVDGSNVTTPALWNVSNPGIINLKAYDSSTVLGQNGIYATGSSAGNSLTFAVSSNATEAGLKRGLIIQNSPTNGLEVLVYPDYGQSFNNVANLNAATPATVGFLRHIAVTGEADQLGAVWESQNQQSNVGSTLDGFFLLQYSKSKSGMVAIVVDAEKSTSISIGDTVATLPEGYRPEYHKWPVFTLINSNQSMTAQCVVLDDGRVRFISVSGASNKFFGQCTFSSNTL